MAIEKAILQTASTDADSEERENFRRGGGSRGRGGGGSKGGGRGGRGGGGRRGGGSRGRGKGSSKGSSGGQGQSRGGPGKGRSSSSAGKGSSGGQGQTRGGPGKGRKSSSASQKSKSSSTSKQGQTRRGSTTTAKSKAAASSRPTMKDVGVTVSKTPTKQRVSTLDKKKMRSPTAFSPQDVAAAIGRKSLADVKAGEFKSRNAAYKANQAAVDAQKARFDGYSPSARSDTSAIAGYGGINAKNLGLGVQGAYNRAQDRNETTGMGFADSVRFQATRPEFKNDIDNLKSIAGSIPTPMNIARKMAMGLLNPDGTAVAQAPEQTGGIMDSLKNMIANRPAMDLEAQRQAQQRDGGRGYETPPMFAPTLPPQTPPTPGGGMFNKIEKLPIQTQPFIPSYMKLAGYGDDEAQQLMSLYNPGSNFTI